MEHMFHFEPRKLRASGAIPEGGVKRNSDFSPFQRCFQPFPRVCGLVQIDMTVVKPRANLQTAEIGPVQRFQSSRQFLPQQRVQVRHAARSPFDSLGGAIRTHLRSTPVG
jgi:hypothetical protein